MTPTVRLLAALAIAAATAAPAFAAAPPDTIPAGAYTLEPEHTQVMFAVNHLGFSTYYGNFAHASGSLTFNPGAVASSQVSISIPTASVSTTNAKLTGELASPGWLDAAKFPAITFVATKVTVTGNGVGTIAGNLTLHGVTRPVTLAASFHGAGMNGMSHKYTLGFDATGAFNRSEFGVPTLVPYVSDEVKVIIAAVFEQ